MAKGSLSRRGKIFFSKAREIGDPYRQDQSHDTNTRNKFKNWPNRASRSLTLYFAFLVFVLYLIGVVENG